MHICIHLWNHHHSKKWWTYPSLPKVSLCPFIILSWYHLLRPPSSPHSPPGNHWLNLLSVATLHFLEFYKIGIIQYYSELLSLRVIIEIHPFISSLFPFIAEQYFIVWFFDPFIYWGIFELFLVFGFTYKAALNICVQVLVWTYAFISLG